MTTPETAVEPGSYNQFVAENPGFCEDVALRVYTNMLANRLPATVEEREALHGVQEPVQAVRSDLQPQSV